MNKNYTVLVTGADGFIGSHLTEQLVARGFNVRALAQYNSFNQWGWLEQINGLDKVEVVCGDIRDSGFCHTIAKDIDVIFHLAALIAIPYSYQAPESYVDTNIKGTMNICSAALAHQVKRIICTSTSEVYGTAQYVPIDEKHPLQPQSPYSATKIAADALAMSFHNAFGLPLTIARPFNTYGPRQSARAVIPTVITQIASGKKQIRIGDLEPTRDFNYVLDTCDGMIALASCDAAKGETVNIGSNFEISIGDTVRTIAELMECDIEIVTDDKRIRPKNSEVMRLWCDNKKIQKLTNFSPAHDIRHGLAKTIEWFRQPENLYRYKPDLYNV
jgi:NAD dependent epimerase/dehydratase